MKKSIKQIPAHLSPSGFRMSETKGRSYEAFHSLEEARQHAEGVTIFEGDYGGTIYLTAPARNIHCNESALNQLLADIDARYWNDPRGAKIYYERLPVGATVAGGMGGGKVLDKFWLHEKIRPIVPEQEIDEVFAGIKERISPPPKTGP